MAGKIKVYGKAQNRTALGIAHAYLVMYPHATLADLRKAFPNTLNPDMGVKELFLPEDEARKFNNKMNLYFAKEDEVLELQDGQKVALAQVWSKPSFDRMVSQGSLYDIEVAEFEKTSHPGQKGGYRLEYLNGYVPPMPESKKKSLGWLWALLGIILLALIAWLIFGGKKEAETVVVEKVVEKQVVVRDTVFVQLIEEIEANFNAAQFEQGKADLNDDAKLALHDLAKVMKQNPSMKLRITGHTSSEGSEDVNQKLSADRAKAALDFLVNKEGISPERITSQGKGSSEPVDPNNPQANRRTEFEVIE
ncbi:MAG: OmpA family protein [Candidatus Amulumruptor caecigallinarius]|nr:OmpA family protein [Candidatus Amulumruptor caecigallinarius]MCM1396771.1 OmpA family protein [Candidatus Amulumruptor caecigallinarius]MCM1454534.1 OmpA family protein [bacterium]